MSHSFTKRTLIRLLMNNRSILLLLLLITGNCFAANEQLVGSLSGKVQQPGNVVLPIAVNAQINIQDQWYSYMIANPIGSGANAWDNIFTVDKAQTIVKLRYDDSDRKKMNNTYNGQSWKITIGYTVTCYNQSGIGTVYGSVATPELVEITYDPVAGLYTDQSLKVYANSHKARLTVLTVTYTEYNNLGVQVYSQGTIPSYLNDVWLDVEENVSRCYYMSASTPGVYQHTVANNQMELSWPYIQGAESYDVEFLFVDVPSGSFSSSTIKFDFRNATRINTPNKHFVVSLAYPRGKIIYRVRGVGRDPLSPQTRVEGPWSYDPVVGTALSAVPTNSGMTYYSYDFSGLELPLNWQYSATYVEDGKKAEAISFYDGSMHNRQNVTVCNTDNNAVVSETKYDYQGRPAVQMLPAVTSSTGLEYYQYYNGSDYYSINNYGASNLTYGPANYDDDGSTNAADAVTTSSGAGQYYSVANTSDGNNADYIPDAGGYPFAQTRYMNDGTGRVRSQGGAGDDHQLGSRHETRYFYGTPGGQVEVDRLFGNDVGYVSHYKKNMVQDPNGQVSIVYLDQEGRVVATCLAGDAPSNLIPLEQSATPYSLTVDLLGTNHLDQQQDMVSVNTLTVSTPGNFNFSYTLAYEDHCDNCMQPLYSRSGCVDCIYDLVIMITNTDGDSIDINGASSGYAYRFNGISSQSPALTFTVNLTQVGVYTVTKTLRLASGAQTTYRANYISNQKDPANTTPCITMPSVTPVPCGPGCNTATPPACPECTEAYTTGYDAQSNPYYITANGTTLTTQQRLDSIAYCNTIICGHNFTNIIPDPCDLKRDQMLADMSPGGQYFDNLPALHTINLTNPTGPTTPNANYLSYYNGATYVSGDENNWLNANVKDDENAANQSWFNTNFGTGINNWKDVRDNWNAAWADDVSDLLFTEHPEICAYNYFCKGTYCTVGGTTITHATVWSQDQAMLMLHTNTISNTYFNPTCLTQNTTDVSGGGDKATPHTNYMPVSGCTEDPYFKCDPTVCSTSTYGETVVNNILKNYVPVYDEVQTFKGYFSIWYLLEDPDNIAGCAACTTDLSQSTIDVFTQVQSGITNSTYTKFDYFRGAYMYAKDMVIAMGYDEHVTTYSCPNNQSTPQTYAEGYLVTNAGLGPVTPQRFVAHFPENPMYVGLDGCETINGSLDLSTLLTANLTGNGGYQDDNCLATCEAFSYDWMRTLGTCIPNADTAHVRDLLVKICELSCNNTNPIGDDEYATGYPDPVSGQTFYDFQDVTAYYGTSCTIPVHPAPDPASGTCSCENLNAFVAGTGLDPASGTYQTDLTNAFNALFDPAGTYTWTQLSGWITECALAQPNIANLSALPEPVKCATPTDPASTYVQLAATDCANESNTIADNMELIMYNNALNAAADAYITAYRGTCLNLTGRETFTVTYSTKEYYYTLYYYDQAGNLIKTVPPVGVNPITSSSILTAVQNHRNDPATYPMASYPNHTLATNYKYNSLQQLTESTTPDGGLAKFWYDEHGRIVLSQNARQVALGIPGYSYTLYDALGRPYEAGETYSSTPMDYPTSRSASARTSWISNAFTTNGKKQVVRTYYDAQIPGSGTNDYVSGGQQNLRNRVSSITYEETSDASDLTFDNASHYSYDIHGSVATLVQENRNFNLASIGQSKKRTDYEYDVASGKVNAVHYQDGGSNINAVMDEFHHKYEYDANNRMTAAYTSRDGYVWDRDANYLYYDHGPLARTEVGTQHVMGLDYAYTIHGWIKGVNSETREKDRDINKDGGTTATHLNYSFARDAAGYILHYYAGDYAAIHSASMGSNFIASQTNQPTNAYKANHYDLYNGNIAQMTTAITDNTQTQLDVQGRNFRYDQLNRIKEVTVYKDANLTTNNYWSSAGTSNNGDYAETFTYDLNGNILTAIRNGHLTGTSQQMDNMTYNYYANTNRLNFVTDAATCLATDYGNDIDNGQVSGNYTYDATGNLISDASEQIQTIEWTATGRVKTITRTMGSIKADLEFIYDAMGNRIIKIVKPRSGGVPNSQDKWTYTYYVRDASGNVMAVYERTFSPDDEGNYFDNFGVKEWHMYGSTRIGIRKPVSGESNQQVSFSATIVGVNFQTIAYGTLPPVFSCTDGCTLNRKVGKKEFEFTNHLGNVLKTVTDVHLPNGTASSNTVDYYMSDVVGYSDYYVFGAAQSNRVGGDYRYAFNGKEETNEISEGDLDFGARVYDAKLGRWTAADPHASSYPSLTPYCGIGNSPLLLVDPDGQDITGWRALAGSAYGPAFQALMATKGFTDFLSTFQSTASGDQVVSGKTGRLGGMNIDFQVVPGTDPDLNGARGVTIFNMPAAGTDPNQMSNYSIVVKLNANIVSNGDAALTIIHEVGLHVGNFVDRYDQFTAGKITYAQFFEQQTGANAQDHGEIFGHTNARFESMVNGFHSTLLDAPFNTFAMGMPTGLPAADRFAFVQNMPGSILNPAISPQTTQFYVRYLAAGVDLLNDKVFYNYQLNAAGTALQSVGLSRISFASDFDYQLWLHNNVMYNPNDRRNIIR